MEKEEDRAKRNKWRNKQRMLASSPTAISAKFKSQASPSQERSLERPRLESVESKEDLTFDMPSQITSGPFILDENKKIQKLLEKKQ